MIKDIVRVEYGKSSLPESAVFVGGNYDKKIPIIFSVFLVITDNRKILIDAGCETMPDFEIVDFIGTIGALKNLGYIADEITDVIITHSHHDHIECVGYFKNALIHIQKLEYEFGKQYIPNDFICNIFKDECILEDDIKIIKIGGHTSGSCIVECIFDNKKYIFCGDECYSFYNINNKIAAATSISEKRNMDFIKKYSRSEYVCLLCHEKRCNCY